MSCINCRVTDHVLLRDPELARRSLADDLAPLARVELFATAGPVARHGSDVMAACAHLQREGAGSADDRLVAWIERDQHTFAAASASTPGPD